MNDSLPDEISTMCIEGITNNSNSLEFIFSINGEKFEIKAGEIKKGEADAKILEEFNEAFPVSVRVFRTCDIQLADNSWVVSGEKFCKLKK